MDDRPLPLESLVNTLAHEIGHFLSLRHTTELDFARDDLVEVMGRPMLEWILEALAEGGFSRKDVVFVCGYKADILKARYREFTYVENRDWENNNILASLFYAEPANVNRQALREIIDYPWIVPGVSDGGAHTKFFTGGRYPTEFLSRIVREEAMCSLEHAHWRLSALNTPRV